MSTLRPASLALALLIMAFHLACSGPTPPAPTASSSTGQAQRTPFGTLPDGSAVELFTLTNKNGVEVRAMSYGAVIQSLRVPDRRGERDDIVLGYDTAAEYVEHPSYFGTVVGRYANRIANARFMLDGRTYQLAANNGRNHLHGGVKGFDKVTWKGEVAQDPRGQSVSFRYRSPDGEEGYPGTLDVRVSYTLTDGNELIVDYHAITSARTVVNLSQHSFFNLAGQAARDVLDHELQIEADRFTPVDDTLIPTGELASVADTPFDFRTSTAIGKRIGGDHVQLVRGRGYDHNFVLTRTGDGLQRAARVVEPSTGRTMEVSSTEPGLQFYSGNFLDGTLTSKQGRVVQQRFGFCLETQHFPDSPNKPSFPSTVLDPGAEYRSTTVFKFGVAQ